MTHHTGHTDVGGEDKFTLVPSMSVSHRDVRTRDEHTKRERAIFNRAGPHKRKQNPKHRLKITPHHTKSVQSRSQSQLLPCPPAKSVRNNLLFVVVTVWFIVI